MGTVGGDLSLGNCVTLTPWYSAHHLYSFQPLLGHGPWADAKEPSSGGGQGAEHPCLG